MRGEKGGGKGTWYKMKYKRDEMNNTDGQNLLPQFFFAHLQIFWQNFWFRICQRWGTCCFIGKKIKSAFKYFTKRKKYYFLVSEKRKNWECIFMVEAHFIVWIFWCKFHRGKLLYNKPGKTIFIQSIYWRLRFYRHTAAL